jgi:epoxyqueuosine reductase QueG
MVSKSQGDRTSDKSCPTRAIRDNALRIRFDTVGTCEANFGSEARERLTQFIRAGCHDDMGWLATRTQQRRRNRPIKSFFSLPIKRIGCNRFVWNVLIAIGNSDDSAFRPSAEALRGDSDPTIAEAADWALSQLDQSSS